MEKIKHLKIEIATYLFPKFTRIPENVFDSCMHFYFFTCTDVGWGRTRQPSLVSGWTRRTAPDQEVVGPELLIYLPYIYIVKGGIGRPPCNVVQPIAPTQPGCRVRHPPHVRKKEMHA
jgi:hypothetical protein